MASSEHARLARERLSRQLRWLRTAAGVTGTAAAHATGMSQSKLSKIENGLLLPSVTDVERLATAFGAAEKVRAELVELTRSLRVEAKTRRVLLHRGMHRHQQIVSHSEAHASISRYFAISLVPTLLQCDSYLRIALAAVPLSERDMAFEKARTRRARIDDCGKQFVFLLTEGALRWRIGSANVMVEQVEHLMAVHHRPNVRLCVVPWSASADVPAPHGFAVYDEHAVAISALTGNAKITHPRDVREYLHLFNRLSRLSVRGEELQRLLRRIADDHRSLSSFVDRSIHWPE